ncbi:hypothetical protein OGAPHI_004843 [Ogataea philodendri]|uniref:Glutamate--tRNA ligase, mitochondrial n=1 Tax=Ogataea philodendri TaxID=1378263 RepID=A0A9P8T3F5_9ASCO|nr:uncharacterized protein OGAPHI_004843 [Ogataea philodendri]KAH3664129.1 hypothetical protein OGAPHI_004843 [Ogataea philodendri]
MDWSCSAVLDEMERILSEEALDDAASDPVVGVSETASSRYEMLGVRGFHSYARRLGPSTRFSLRKKTQTKIEGQKSENAPVRTRFAPSPTGFLHLGSLRTALYNYLYARATNGQFLIRLEDTDQNRLVQGAEENLYQTLDWLGLKVDEGPQVGGPYSPYRQSDRKEIYSEHIKILLDKGLAYRCFCSKSRLDGLRDSARLLKPPTTVSYDRNCLKHYTKEESDAKAANNEQFTVRFVSPEKYPEFTDLLHGTINWQPQVNQFDRRYEDPVLMKSDGLPTYHFANVVDDRLMKITHVIRGEEWLASTPKHIALYEAFGWPAPKFVHIPLLTTVENKKLSKRSGDIDIMSLKKQGYLSEALINFSVLFGWSPKRDKGKKSNEKYDLKTLEETFSLDGLTVGNAKVDFRKLSYFNKLYLQEKLEDPAYREKVALEAHEKLADRYAVSLAYVSKVIDKAGGSLVTLDMLYSDQFEFYFAAPEYTKDGLAKVLAPEHNELVTLLAQESDFTNLDEVVARVLAKLPELKKKVVYQTIRYAISADKPGTNLPVMIDILGNDEVVSRIKALDQTDSTWSLVNGMSWMEIFGGAGNASFGAIDIFSCSNCNAADALGSTDIPITSCQNKNKRLNQTPANVPEKKQKTEQNTVKTRDQSQPEPIVIDSDDDVVIPHKKQQKIDFGESDNEFEPVKKEITPSPKKSPKKTPTPRKPKTTKAESAGNHEGDTAQDILKTIPDADPKYLTVDPETENMSFFQLKARTADAPAPSGDRLLPEGRPNCLNGLTVVFTGILPTIDRDECVRIASKYGAKVTKSISGKTSLVVIGHDAGPKKVKVIKEKKIKCIDEDGFVELLRKMPSDGGSGEAAQAAMAKKLEEEKKAIEDAEREEEQERKRQQKLKQERSSQPSQPQRPSDKPDSEKLWTVKYAPTDIKQICGNKGNLETLQSWLENWFDNAKRGFTGSGINGFRAVLISGPPGIGKTTAATLVAKSLGYDVIEKNASDVRSKKLLNEQLKSSLSNSSVVGYFNQLKTHDANNRKIVMIMDEVDGMSSGDHGGGAQLSQFCRVTETPLILICNDKSLPKMRTFDKTCFDMTWRKPTSKEMKSRLMTIAHREGLKLDPNIVDQLVSATNNDIRQIINIMSTVARTQKSLSYDNSEEITKSWQKEVVLKPFDIVLKLLSGASYGPNARYNLNEKINFYFNDMDFTPLMIHENYRSTAPAKLNRYSGNQRNLAHLELLEEASDAISQSDLVSQLIRGSEQQWSLAPFHGVISSIIPGSKVAGNMVGRTAFTSWLGQNSKKMKYDRLLQELQYHSSIKTKTNNQELRLNYLPLMIKRLSDPLIKRGSEGIDEILSFMDEYYLTKEDWDALMEFGVGPKGRMEQRLKSIPTAVKSGFTRKYNSYTHPTVIYKTGDSVTKNTRTAAPKPDLDDVVDDDMKDSPDDEDAQDDDQDIKKDKLIKEVKRKPTKKRK